MKTLKKILSISAALCAITGSLLVTSCANGSSDDGNTSTVSVPKEGTLTKGQISENVVTTNASNQVVATLEDENGGIYEFTENAVTQNARAAITGSGTWVYKVNGIVKYSGTYVGDISKIGSESLSVELVVTKTTNSIDEPVKVVAQKTFTIEFTEAEFSASIPLVVSGVMDLRIKGGNVANVENVYDCSQAIEWGDATGEVFTKGYVTAKVYTNGILIIFTKPSDEFYSAQSSWNYNIDDGKGTRLWWWSSEDSAEVFWPLCTKGKKIKLATYIAPSDEGNYYDKFYKAEFEIIPAGGIGEIDYSNYDAKKWFTYGWVSGKPVIKFDSSDLILPNGADVESVITFYAGNGIWENGETIWINELHIENGGYEIIVDDDYAAKLIEEIERNGKSQIYYDYRFDFKIPGSKNEASFRTKLFPTTAIDIN